MAKFIIKVTNFQGDSLYVNSLQGSMGFTVKIKARAKKFASKQEAQWAINKFDPIGLTTFCIEEVSNVPAEARGNARPNVAKCM